MKRKNIIPLLVLPLLLTSCGSSDPTSLPNKGTQISAADGKANFKKAYQASFTSIENNNGAFKASVKDSYVTLDYSYEDKVQDKVLRSSSMNCSIHDFNITIAANGLTSSDSNDYHAYAHAGFKAKYDFEFTGAEANASSKMDEKTYSVDAYEDKDYAYLDLSQGDTLDLIKNITCSYSTRISDALENGKIKTTNSLSADDYPILSEEINDKEFTEMEKTLLTEEEDGVYKDHGNGTYSYSYHMDGNDVLDKEKDAEEDGKISNSFYSPSMTSDSSSYVEYAVIYSEKTGITSVGLKGDVKFSFDIQPSSQNPSGHSTKGSLHLTFGMKLSFTYKGSIDVKTVSNPDSYTLVKRSN